jgi:hypothetical protein
MEGGPRKIACKSMAVAAKGTKWPGPLTAPDVRVAAIASLILRLSSSCSPSSPVRLHQYCCWSEGDFGSLGKPRLECYWPPCH